MTDTAGARPAAGTASQSKNSAAPEPAVAAAPCGCEERLDGQAERLGVLEGRWTAQDALNKAMAWFAIVAAATILYIVWTGAGSGAKEQAAK